MMSRFFHRAVVAALVTLGAFAYSGEASAQPEQREFERGLEHYRASEYDEAAAAFRSVHEARGDVESLFAWAQAERLGGHCDVAKPLYQKLLEHDLSSEQRRAATEAIELCEDETAESEPADEPESEPVTDDSPPPEKPSSALVETPPAPTPAPSPRAEAGPGYGPWVLAAASAAALGTGAGFWLSARGQARRAGDASREDDYYRYASRARNRQVVAMTAGIVGSGLAAGAVTWYLFAERPSAESRVAGWFDDESAGLVVTGRF